MWASAESSEPNLVSFDSGHGAAGTSQRKIQVLSGAEDIRLSRRLAGLWPAGRRPCTLRRIGGRREPGNFDGSAILDCVTANGIN
jgi:hypothetical protein